VRVFGPLVAGVYVNVLADDDAVQDKLDGVKVPPADASENVMVSVTVAAGVTVKLELGTPGFPDAGPVTVKETRVPV
jgi:hypothetical protein